MVVPSLTKAAARTVIDCCSKTSTSQPYLVARSALSCARGYATDSESRPQSSSPQHGTSSGTNSNALPRPPPSKQPDVEAFSGPSQPGQYYERPTPRDLPRAGRKWPTILGVAIAGVAGWAAFLTYATNQEKISSSVFRSIVRAVRRDSNVEGVLGEAIRPQPEWWLNGDPYVRGKIGQLQGNIDVSFRIKGSKGAGTVYFTSIRKNKGEPYTTLRFKIIADDGTVVHVQA